MRKVAQYCTFEIEKWDKTLKSTPNTVDGLKQIIYHKTKERQKHNLHHSFPQYTTELSPPEPNLRYKPIDINKKRTTAVVQSLLTLNLIP